MSMNKSSIALVAVVAMLIGFGVAWYLESSKPIRPESVTWFGEQARPLPNFELADHRGQPLTPASQRPFMVAGRSSTFAPPPSRLLE